MANIKVSEMTEATEFDDLDYAMIVQANQNKKIVKDNLFKDVTDSIDDINTSIQNIETDVDILKSNSIVEQGTNYIKYDSGIMMQWGEATVTDAFQTAMGPFYRTATAQNVNFPVNFSVNYPVVLLTPQAAIQIVYFNNYINGKEGFSFWPATGSAAAAASRYVRWLAIGKWK